MSPFPFDALNKFCPALATQQSPAAPKTAMPSRFPRPALGLQPGRQWYNDRVFSFLS